MRRSIARACRAHMRRNCVPQCRASHISCARTSDAYASEAHIRPRASSPRGLRHRRIYHDISSHARAVDYRRSRPLRHTQPAPRATFRCCFSGARPSKSGAIVNRKDALCIDLHGGPDGLQFPIMAVVPRDKELPIVALSKAIARFRDVVASSDIAWIAIVATRC